MGASVRAGRAAPVYGEVVLKISFITTIETNPGDDFVRCGIEYLLGQVGIDFSAFYINKHHALSRPPGQHDAFEAGIDIMQSSDLVIQSGAPFYWKVGGSTGANIEWAKPIYRERLFSYQPPVPFINLAAGSCVGPDDSSETILDDPECVDFIQQVSAISSLNTVRDQLAGDLLAALGIEHYVLPCAAFWAGAGWQQKRGLRKGKLIAVNLMPTGGHYNVWQTVDQVWWEGQCRLVSQELNNRYPEDTVFVAHSREECEWARHLGWPRKKIYYSADYRAYLELYSHCRVGLFNRLHGAVVLAGFGRPSLMLGNDSRLLMADEVGLSRLWAAKTDADSILRKFYAILDDETDLGRELIERRKVKEEIYKKLLHDVIEGFSKKKSRKNIFRGWLEGSR